MAKKFVSRCRVIRNGKTQENLKNWKGNAVPYRAAFQYSGGQGTNDVQKKIGFSIDYVLPKSSAKLDWSDVQDETWIIELNGGQRIIYTGVDSLERGEITVDNEKETVITITFAAETETIQ